MQWLDLRHVIEAACHTLVQTTTLLRRRPINPSPSSHPLYPVCFLIFTNHAFAQDVENMPCAYMESIILSISP